MLYEKVVTIVLVDEILSMSIQMSFIMLDKVVSSLRCKANLSGTIQMKSVDQCFI